MRPTPGNDFTNATERASSFVVGLNVTFALLQGGLLAIAGLAESCEDQAQASSRQSEPHAPSRNEIPDRARKTSRPVNLSILFLPLQFPWPVGQGFITPLGRKSPFSGSNSRTTPSSQSCRSGRNLPHLRKCETHHR